jgi:PAS domain S-box-containing protein
MTNINNLNQKLDDLFQEIELEPNPPEVVEKPVSWTWECDNQGYYTYCSHEVLDILGFHPDEFIGKPMSSYHLTPQSSRKLEVLLGSMAQEGQITVQFRNEGGFSVPIQIKINLTEKEGTNIMGLRGINTILTDR